MRSPAPLHQGRVLQLDGLRAAAVLAVMVQHSGMGWGSGGLYGVDVFFVLSGFLITGVLLGEHRRTGRISLRRFYARRWLRLFPALAVMIVVLTPIGPSLSTGHSWGSWFGSAAAALTYTSNFVMLHTGEVALGVLDPTWSLAVEEQFYLLWPLTLLGLLAIGVRGRPLIALVVAGAAVGLSLFYVLYEPVTSGTALIDAYVRPDARFGEMLVGCALALVLARRAGPLSPRADRLLTAATVVALAGLAVAVELHLRAQDGEASPLAGIPIVAVCAGLIVARLATSDGALASRLLRLSPLPQLGLISYGLYLWHAPVFAVVRESPLGLAGAEQPLQWALTFAAAIVSYRFVERPFLRRKERLRDTPVAGLEPVPASARPATAPA